MLKVFLFYILNIISVNLPLSVPTDVRLSLFQPTFPRRTSGYFYKTFSEPCVFLSSVLNIVPSITVPVFLLSCFIVFSFWNIVMKYFMHEDNSGVCQIKLDASHRKDSVNRSTLCKKILKLCSVGLMEYWLGPRGCIKQSCSRYFS